MIFEIKHEIRGRMHVHFACQQMSNQQADILQYYLSNQKYVTAVKVYEMTADVSVEYVGSREQMCRVFREFQYETAQVPEIYLQNSSRELGAMYRDRLVSKVLLHFLNRFFLPSCVRVAVTINDGAQIAREIADVTIGADDLYEIILLKSISNALVSRIHHNYRKIVSINAGLILLGVSGAIAPTASAFFNNASTLLISMDSMKKLL